MVFLALALVGPLSVEYVVNETFIAQRRLTETSAAYASWEDNTLNPPIITVVAYNVTNPYDVWANGATAVVDEIGPFYYYDYRIKYNISYDDDGAVVYYREWEYFVPLPDQQLNDSVIITTPHMIVQGVYATAINTTYSDDDVQDVEGLFAFFLFLTLGGYNLALQNDFQFLFVNISVREAIFGYDLTYENSGRSRTVSYPGLLPNRSFEADQNMSLYDAVKTGTDSRSNEVHQYVMWHNQSRLIACPPEIIPITPCSRPETLVWADVAASTVGGSDLNAFPIDPAIDETSTLQVFYYPYWRSLALTYVDATEVKGATTLRFTFPSDLYANSNSTPANAVYYQNGPNGLLNASSPSYGVPIFISAPRGEDISGRGISGGDNWQLPSIIVSDMIASIPQFAIDVEPNSGFTFALSTSSQANVLLAALNFSFAYDGSDELTNISLFVNVKTPLVPIAWIAAESVISDEDALTFTNGLLLAEVASDVFIYVGAPICAVLFVGMLYVCVQRERQRQHSAVTERSAILSPTPSSPTQFVYMRESSPSHALAASPARSYQSTIESVGATAAR